MKKSLIIGVMTVFAGYSLHAEDSAKQEFKPGGKPIVKVFADYVNSNTDGNSNNAFEVSRAYFGYGYNLSKNYSGKVLLDVGNPGVGSFQMTAFLKNALVEYKNDMFNVDFGLIGTDMFSLQEKVWGKRYLQKSLQDMDGFGSSADLGLSFNAKINSIISVDAAVLNGEGYKSIQKDSMLKVTGGLTIQPLKNIYARVYADYLKNNESLKPAGKDQTSFNAFLGYMGEKATLAAEYDYQKNSGLTDKKDLTGISVYGSYNILKKGSVFARFDNLSSKDNVNANGAGFDSKKDGQLIIAGLEYAPVKGLRVSPNVQIYNPKQDGAKNTTNFYVNFELSF